MARGGQQDLVLEQRHLLGVFFAVVLLAAIAFAAGFIVGKNRGELEAATRMASVAAAMETPVNGELKAKDSDPKPSDLTFYDRVDKKPGAAEPGAAEPANTVPPVVPSSVTQKTAEKDSSPPPGPPAAKLQAPAYFQVGAFSEEGQARNLAERLTKLGFPSRVQPPKTDKFFRVQAGPFETAELAESARRRLEAHGFRPLRR